MIPAVRDEGNINRASGIAIKATLIRLTVRGRGARAGRSDIALPRWWREPSGRGTRAGSEKPPGRGHGYGRGMSISVQTMFIPVHDPEAALAFYRDALGLEVRMDVSSDGFRWITVGAPGQDMSIVLSQPHGGRSQTEGDALLALVTQGSLQAAIFATDDLDATFEKVRASGSAEILQEPTSQPWGARDCAVRDPSGNLVRIAQA